MAAAAAAAASCAEGEAEFKFRSRAGGGRAAARPASLEPTGGQCGAWRDIGRGSTGCGRWRGVRSESRGERSGTTGRGTQVGDSPAAAGARTPCCQLTADV
jgi:hypothetical protein